MRFHFLRSDGSRFFRLPLADDALSPFLAIPFLLGTVCGSVVGSFGMQQTTDAVSTDLASLLSVNSAASSVAWHSVQFLTASLLLATSILGVLLLPALAAVRAYMLSCAVAAMLRIPSDSSVLFALVLLGIPAFLSLPAFLLLTQDALAFSRRLARPGHAPLRLFSIQSFLQRAGIVLIFCVAEFSYRRFLLPALLGLIG